MARGVRDVVINGRDELQDPFLRSRLQYAYNLDLLEQKYKKLEEHRSGIEIDYVTGDVYAPKNMSKRAAQAKLMRWAQRSQECGLGKFSAPCNSLDVFGNHYKNRVKECQRLDADFNAKLKAKFPKWEPYEPRRRRRMKRTIRETVKELVFEGPIDSLNYLMKIRGIPSSIFEHRGALPVPMIVGDCSESRESSPVRPSAITAAHAQSALMVTYKDCSRSRECSPIRSSSVASTNTRNLMVAVKNCSRSRECSPEDSSPVVKARQLSRIALERDCSGSKEYSTHGVSKATVGTHSNHSGEVTSYIRDLGQSADSYVPMDISSGQIQKDQATLFPNSGSSVTERMASIGSLERREALKPSSTNSNSTCDKSSLSDVHITLPRKQVTAQETPSSAASVSITPQIDTNRSLRGSSLVTRGVRRQRSSSERAVEPSLTPLSAVKCDRTPATSMGLRQEEKTSQKRNKAELSDTSYLVTPTTSKKVNRKALQQGKSAAKKNTSTLYSVTPTFPTCSAPTVGRKSALRLKLKTPQGASPSPSARKKGAVCASFGAALVTEKRAEDVVKKPGKNGISRSAGPKSNKSLSTPKTKLTSKSRSSSASVEIAIGRSSLRPRRDARLETSPLSVTAPAIVHSLSEVDGTGSARSVKCFKKRTLSKAAVTSAAPYIAESCQSSRKRKKNATRNCVSQSSTPPAAHISNIPSSLSPTTPVSIQGKNCWSTMATTSSATGKKGSSESVHLEASSHSLEVPNGVWDESVQTLLKSYEDSLSENNSKMTTILGFDAQKFRRHCGESLQTTLSSFLDFARECQPSSGESYLDNGLKEDRRAMAAAKSRNRALKQGYFA